jgi:Mce-associated membrane protein
MALALALLLVTLLGAGGAYFAWTQAQQAGRARPTGNIAFLDKAATADVKDQVSKAIEAIYSYDSAQLDQSENNALSFITGTYADEFKRNFATVRQLAPQEKAQLTSTVVEVGVDSLTQSRATLLVMVNQVGHRGDNPQPLRAAVRLSVTAEKLGGQWKVSGVNQK